MGWLEPAGLLPGRCLLALLFPHEGWAKLMAYDAAVHYAQVFGVPEVGLMAAITLELAGGLAILSGLATRIMSLGLAVFCLAAAAIFYTALSDRG